MRTQQLSILKQNLKPVSLLVAFALVAACQPKAQTPTAVVYSTMTAPPPTASQTPKPTLAASEPPGPMASPTGTPDISRMRVISSEFHSPNGRWLITATSALPIDESGVAFGDHTYAQVKVFETEGGKDWTPIDRWSPGGCLGSGGYEPLLWAADGQDLCITYRPVPDGCGVFVNGSDLWELDLETGLFVQIVPRVGLWLSLSPDETRLAYVGYGDQGLVIRDLRTGEERDVKLDPGEEYDAGHVVWSPDGRAIMLTLAFETCGAKPIGSTSVIRVDLPNLEQTTLVSEDERAFETIEWPTPDQILLRDATGGYWWMNPDTGEITPK